MTSHAGVMILGGINFHHKPIELIGGELWFPKLEAAVELASPDIYRGFLGGPTESSFPLHFSEGEGSDEVELTPTITLVSFSMGPMVWW